MPLADLIYDVGTISVANGSSTVTGTGVLWSDFVDGGDTLDTANGSGKVFAVNAGFDQITLLQPWPWPSLVAQPYKLLKDSPLRTDGVLVAEDARDVLHTLNTTGLFIPVVGAAPDPGAGADGQWALKTNDGSFTTWQKIAGVWVAQGGSAIRLKGAVGNITLYTNYDTGNDVTGDGAIGNPYKSVMAALGFIQNRIDFIGLSANTRYIIQMADNVFDADGIHWSGHAFVGAQGGDAVIVRGGTNSSLLKLELYFSPLRIENVTFVSAGIDIDLQWGATLHYSGIKFGGGTRAGSLIRIGRGTNMIGAGAMTIGTTGVVTAFSIIQNEGGSFTTNSHPVAFGTNATFTYTAYLNGGQTAFAGTAITNAFTVTGTRFHLANGATFTSFDGLDLEQDYLPGHIAGVNISGFYDGVSAQASKIGSFTRDISLASGNFSINGIGFKPKSITFLSNQNASSKTSIGIDDGVSRGAIWDADLFVDDTWAVLTNTSIRACQSATDIWDGQIVSFDNDGFTIAGTKSGSPTGTITVLYRAER